jgi:S1-C subfamily serine protease
MRRKSGTGVELQMVIGLLLILAVAGCSGLGGGQTATPAQPAAARATAELPAVVTAPTQPAVVELSTAPTSQALTDNFRDVIRQVAEQVKPAVVQVTNEQMGFGTSDAVPVGVGSGIIYDSQGHILTNNHVVEGASSIVVSLTDGRTFTATLLGADARTDLAVIQIAGSNLPVAQLGDSMQLQVGDWVIAIGNALALPGGPTVTAGVVSATDRSVQEPSTTTGMGTSTAGPFLFGLIQTDAPINPGNSGGPLVNLDGQVVGINTLGGGTTSSGVQTYGIGFAISTATARPVAEQLVAMGKVVHTYLGITYVPLSPATAVQAGVSVSYGAYITSVVSGSPAAAADLQADDVITAIDGTQLENDSDLSRILSGHKPGDTVALNILRGGQNLTIGVTLGELNS